MYQTREKDESIAANMRQYGTSSYYLDVVVADFSYPLWRADLRIDAIVTDRKYKYCIKFSNINYGNSLRFTSRTNYIL